MAVLKTILGYEICLWDIEGNVFRGIPVVLIRKNHFTEIVSIENGEITHEMGDKIIRQSVRDGVYRWIADNIDKLIEEYALASSYTEDYKPKNF